MTLVRMVIREIFHHKLNFGLSLFAVMVAAGAFVGSVTVLSVHDVRTRQILLQKEEETQKRMAALKDEMRKATLKLSFNLLILPEGQDIRDWHAKGYGTTCMPETYVDKLAGSGTIVVRHFLPTLQQKVKWVEKGSRTIILVGTRGEVPNLFKDPRRPLVQQVPPGTIVLGHELHETLGLKVGDRTRLMGRTFTVHKCHKERGSSDDITAWISLREAQEILNKKGLVNAILALECLCVGRDPGRVRKEITEVLPGTQLVEMGTKSLARAEARFKVKQEAKVAVERERRNRARLRVEREGVAAILIPIVLVACAAWIGLLAFWNVRQRRGEIGVLRAVGFRSRSILLLFLSKSLAGGLLGGGVGIVGGLLLGGWLGDSVEAGPPVGFRELLSPTPLVLGVCLAAAMAIVATWIPAVLAVRDDPAVILRGE